MSKDLRESIIDVLTESKVDHFHELTKDLAGSNNMPPLDHGSFKKLVKKHGLHTHHAEINKHLSKLSRDEKEDFVDGEEGEQKKVAAKHPMLKKVHKFLNKTFDDGSAFGEHKGKGYRQDGSKILDHER